MSKENEKATISENASEQPDVDYAFTIIRTTKGDLHIKPASENKISTEQIRVSCETIIRNMNAEEIATATAGALLVASQQFGRSENGLVLPDHMKGK